MTLAHPSGYHARMTPDITNGHEHIFTERQYFEGHILRCPCGERRAVNDAQGCVIEQTVATTEPVADLVAVPRRWVEEVVQALDAASIIGARSCAPGDGLHLANHDRLIREAVDGDWSPYLIVKSLPESGDTTHA